jgi:hypothetical protein
LSLRSNPGLELANAFGVTLRQLRIAEVIQDVRAQLHFARFDTMDQLD